MRTLEPFSILHFKPLLMTYLPFKMLLQAKDPLFSLASKMVPCGKNFVLKNLKNRESWFCNKRQICLPSIASLNFCNSRKPIPPSDLGLHILLHLTQWIRLLVPRWPHQNFLIIASISWQSVIGSLKQLIEYVGMACTTAFKRTSLPAWDRIFSFHP